MPERKTPISRIRLRSQVARWAHQVATPVPPEPTPDKRRYRGWGQKDVLANLVGEMEEYIAPSGSSEGYKGMIPEHWQILDTRTGQYKKVEPAVHLISDPVNAMIVTPWIDNSQRLDLTAFEPIGDYQGYWNDYVRDFEGIAVTAMIRATPPLLSGAIGYTGLQSLFALSRNPIFAVRLWRGLPGATISADARRHLRTEITFGLLSSALQSELEETHGHSVSIQIPYDGRIKVLYKHLAQTGNDWKPMLGKTRGLNWGSTTTPQGMPNAQFATIWIGCFRSGIVISSDRFQDDLMYLQFPISTAPWEDPLLVSASETDLMFSGAQVDGVVHDVPAGHLQARHNAGMWFFSLLPLLSYAGTDTAKLWGPLHDARYPLRDSGGSIVLDTEELVLQAQRRHKIQPPGAYNPGIYNADENLEGRVLVTDVTGTTDATSRAQATRTMKREWRAEYQPTKWAHRFQRQYGAARNLPMQQYQTLGDDPLTAEAGYGTFRTHVTPELYTVNKGEFARLVSVDTPIETDVHHLAPSVGFAIAPDAHGAECQMVLDNTQAEVRELRDQGSREITVELGYELDDNTTEYSRVLTGLILDSVASESALAMATVVPRVLDFQSVLARATADGMLPCFDGWAVWRVFQFILRRAGFSDNEMGIGLDAGGNLVPDMTNVTQGIEDTNAYLSVGPPEKSLWLFAPNTPLATVLRNVAEYDYDATYWWSPTGVLTKGCRYCRRRRDGRVGQAVPSDPQHPQRHVEPAGSNSSGCIAHDIVRSGDAQGIDHELYSVVSDLASGGVSYVGPEILSFQVENVRAWGQARGFANRIQVTAPNRSSANVLYRRQRNASADVVTAIIDDPGGSIDDPLVGTYAHGEVIDHVYDERLMHEADAVRKARELLARRASTTEYIELELPCNPQIAIGEVFRVHGGDIGTNVRNHVYRVTYVEHDMPSQNPIDCRTRLGGIYLRTEAPP